MGGFLVVSKWSNAQLAKWVVKLFDEEEAPKDRRERSCLTKKKKKEAPRERERILGLAVRERIRVSCKYTTPFSWMCEQSKYPFPSFAPLS